MGLTGKVPGTQYVSPKSLPLCLGFRLMLIKSPSMDIIISILQMREVKAQRS